MKVPDYLTYFFRDMQRPFEVLSDLDEQTAASILLNDTEWRGDGTYLAHRKRHEQLLREQFIGRGRKSKRHHPIYMILGDSPTGPHDMTAGYDYLIRIPLSLFSAEEVSSTYPDSLYKVPLDDLGRLYLERNTSPTVYRLEELPWVISTYRVYEYSNHYVEAQVWDKARVLPFGDRVHWERCHRVHPT